MGEPSEGQVNNMHRPSDSGPLKRFSTMRPYRWTADDQLLSKPWTKMVTCFCSSLGVEIGLGNVSATCTTDCRNSSALIDFQAARSSTLSDSFFQNVILENSSPKPSDLVLRFVIIQYIGFAPRVILVCGSRQPKEGRL